MRRRACKTRALRRPFGPFFFGGCRYAHRILAFLHGVHGSWPSHFTFLFLQQSHARLSCLVGALPPSPLPPLAFVEGSEVGGGNCVPCVSAAISFRKGCASALRRCIRAFSHVVLAYHITAGAAPYRVRSIARMVRLWYAMTLAVGSETLELAESSCVSRGTSSGCRQALEVWRSCGVQSGWRERSVEISEAGPISSS